MDYFGGFAPFLQVVLVAFATVSAMVIERRLQEKYSALRRDSIAVVVISTVFIIINLVVASLINASSTIRKFIDEDNFIEGHYYDIISSPSGQTGAVLGLLSITYDNGTYKVNGTSWNRDGEKTSSFNSVSSAYQDGILIINHKTYPFVGESTDGFNRFVFDTPPLAYSGDFMELDKNPQLINIQGIKISTDEVETYNELKEIEDKQSFALAMIKKHKLGSVAGE